MQPFDRYDPANFLDLALKCSPLLYFATTWVPAPAEEKEVTDEELLTFTHFAQYFAQRAQSKHAESASLGERLQQQQV